MKLKLRSVFRTPNLVQYSLSEPNYFILKTRRNEIETKICLGLRTSLNRSETNYYFLVKTLPKKSETNLNTLYYCVGKQSTGSLSSEAHTASKFACMIS
jgi:hypothetical protein